MDLVTLYDLSEQGHSFFSWFEQSDFVHVFMLRDKLVPHIDSCNPGAEDSLTCYKCVLTNVSSPLSGKHQPIVP